MNIVCSSEFLIIFVSLLWKCHKYTPNLQRVHHLLRTQSFLNLLIFNGYEHYLQSLYSRLLLRDLSHIPSFKNENEA